MDMLTENEAKIDEYNFIELLKLRLLQSRVAHIKTNITTGKLIEGESFFNALKAGQYD